MYNFYKYRILEVQFLKEIEELTFLINHIYNEDKTCRIFSFSIYHEMH